MDYLARALSIRVILLSVLVGACVSVLVNMAWPSVPFAWVMWPVAFGCYLLAVLNASQMTRCDACHKRVKMGASTCHHCGYSRA